MSGQVEPCGGGLIKRGPLTVQGNLLQKDEWSSGTLWGWCYKAWTTHSTRPFVTER